MESHVGQIQDPRKQADRSAKREKVLVETLPAALGLRQPQEIELYGNAFDQLAAVATYGRSARAIITHVIDDLAQEVPEDDGVAR